MQDSEGNEENGHPVPDSNKTKINDSKEANDAHKNILNEEILHKIYSSQQHIEPSPKMIIS
jgi:hypothetical protein